MPRSFGKKEKRLSLLGPDCVKGIHDNSKDSTTSGRKFELFKVITPTPKFMGTVPTPSVRRTALDFGHEPRRQTDIL